jgi:nitrogen fixation NifU-like protein
MSEAVKGKDLPSVRQLFDRVHALLTDQRAAPDTGLGKLAALSGVREFPARVKCASLCWHTLSAALERGASTVTTEVPDEVASGLGQKLSGEP